MHSFSFHNNWDGTGTPSINLMQPSRNNNIMQAIKIKIAESVEQAPNYARDFPNVKSATLHQAIVVKKGTQEGNCTVDLVFVSADGTEHVALTTGAIIRSLANIIAGIDTK